MRTPLVLTLAVAACLTSLPRLAAAPDWIADPGNSQWIILGGEAAVAEENGLHPHPGGGEGELVSAERDGVPCAQSVRPNGAPGLFYLKADPWNEFRAWQGDHDLLLTLRYWDGAPGQLIVRYDSSDARVKNDPYPAGVWRYPDALPQGVKLEGSKTWKTLTVRLELAMFTKRVHGADFRLDPTSADFALAGAAVTRVPRQAVQVLATQNLRVDRATGFESFGSGARFIGSFVQRADEPVVIEAENAATLALRDGHTPGTDPQASGGGYIHFVASASWKFTLRTAGRYIAWERAFFPWAGGWNHTESMDGGAGITIIDGMRTPEEGWQWIRAGEYDLAAGEHVFQTAYEGGARLDVIVLSTSDQPPDLAALAPSYVGPSSGEIWTAPVKPFDVAAWKTVRFEVAGPTAEVVYEYSTDSGQTWTVFDPGAGLEALRPLGGGQDALQFHLKVTGVEGGLPPLFAGGSVEYVAGPDSVRYVENDRLKLGLDPYGVYSIYDKRAGRAIAVAPETHDALVGLVTKPVGDASTTSHDLYNATLEDFQVGGEADSPTVTMVHLLANGMRLTSSVRLLPDGQMEWQLGIDNPTRLEVCEVRFPVVTGVALGGNPADDWIFMAKPWGQVWQNPGAQRLSTFWGPSMRWMDVWDDQSGLYLGIEDPKFEDYAFVYGGDRSGGITMAAHQRILAPPAGSWKSGVYRLAVTGGDWHEGGDIYRRYVARALRVPDVPPHVKWLLDGWQGQNSNLAPFIGWEMINNGLQGISLYDPYFMAANRQMVDGMDSGYCGLYPYPAPGWGTTREFSQKLALRRALGGMYTPYHNFHLWSPGYGHYGRIGSFPKSKLPADAPLPDDAWYARAATYSYSGSYARAETDYFGQYDMAMPSKEWRDWLYDWTQRYLTWGTDGMYYDQFNMIYGNGRLYPDFATYGAWAPATLEVFTRMKHDSRARNPYYTSSGEVCNDVYGQYLDLHMTSGVWNRLDFWSYCNPRQILIDGVWNGGLAPVWGGWQRERFIWQCGARFEHMQGPPENGQEWLQKLLDLRRATKCLIYDADFRDTVGLTVQDPEGRPLGAEQFMTGSYEGGPFRGVSGRWFLFKQAEQSGAVINFINVPLVPGAVATFSTKETGPISSAVAFTFEGRRYPVAGTQKGDSYTFPVPESECSTVVLVSGQMRPLVSWDLAGPATGGSRRALLLRVTNPNATAMSGTATLRLPRGWSAPAPVRFGPLPPGESRALRVSFTVPADAARGRADVWCDVTADGLTFSTYSFITVNEPVLVDFRGNPGNYHVWVRNLAEQPLTGTVAVSAPAPLRVSCAPQLAIPAEAEVEVPVIVEGRDSLREISEMLARVTLGGKTTEVVRAVMPLIPNGDFEMDGAGDMKPDWWMCRKLMDEWAYERIHLSAEAHGGQRSLLLDPPQGGDQFIRAYPTNGCFTPNTRYRVSVWIKAESDRGVQVRIAGLTLGSGQTGPEWKEFTGEFTTGADPNTGGWVGCSLINESAGKAWFDDLVVEEVK